MAWLSERQQQILALRDYETSALSDIQKWSDLSGGTPLFKSIVVFENYPATGPTELGFTVQAVQSLEQSNYPLALLVVPGKALELILLYSTACYDSGSITRLQQHLELLLTAFVERPESKLAELPRLTEEEQAQLVRQPVKESVKETDSTVHELIEAQARRTPDAEAVSFNGQVLTYRELNDKADRLAVELRSQGVVVGDRVAICLNRSLAMIVSILAVLKSGATYVPLDPAYPQSRLAYCLEDTVPRIICTERAVELPSESISRISISCLYIDELNELPIRDNAENGNSTSAQPEDLAYIIYTSGSTGRPKGVMVSHRNLVQSTTARFSVYPDKVGRFLLLSSIAFDSSVAGLFWTLCQGGTLVISPPRIEQDLQQLTKLIAREQITHTLCVPTLYALLLSDAAPAQLSSLKTVIVAGEACSRTLAQQHYRQLSKAQLYNEYGPTEATVWCSAYRVPAELPPGPVAIGSAIPGVQILLLDADFRPVPTGAIGEIYIGGPTVTKGYLNQPEKTAVTFVTPHLSFTSSNVSVAERSRSPVLYKTGDLARLRSDGSLEWLGRIDRQVKIRGYRIELGEIEEVLRSQPNIQEAVVIARSAEVSAVEDSTSVESLSEALQDLSFEAADALLRLIESSAVETQV